MDDIALLIDWQAIAELLALLYAAPKGEVAWPPLTLFRKMLPAVWYDLSDVKLAAHSLDRSLFETVTGQFKARTVQIKIDTIVDATIIASQTEGDGEARWVKHRAARPCMASKLMSGPVPRPL